MRKLLLSIIILLSLSACNTDKNSSTSVPQKTAEQKKPKVGSTDATSMEKEKKFRQIMAADHLPNGLNETERAFAIAVRAGEEAKVEELLQQGANPNQEVTDDYYAYRSALCKVAHDVGMGYPNQKEYENIVKLLLKSGANANENCSCGTTPLMLASSLGRSPVTVKALIEAGADVNAKDKEGKTALLHAYYDDEIVKVLLNAGADINAVDNTGNGAFIYASKYGNADIVQLLLDKGVKVSQEDKDEALRLACPEANIEVVEVLLSAGANVNSKDKNGKTALMYTTPYGYYEENMSRKVMEKLIAEGADVNTTDNDGGTALMAVVSDFTDGEEGERDRLELIDTLITAGANVNAADNKGKTALMYIILDGYNDFSGIATKLLKAGANVNATDTQGRTVLMDFVSKVDEKEAALSDEEGPAGSLEYPTTKKILEGLKVLLKAGADVNAKDKDGNTALKLAKKAGNTKIVELLKQAGAKE